MTWSDVGYMAAMGAAVFAMVVVLSHCVWPLRRVGVAPRPAGGQGQWTTGDIVLVGVFYVGLSSLCGYLVDVASPGDMTPHQRYVAQLATGTFANVVVCAYILLMGEIQRGKPPSAIGLSGQRLWPNVLKGIGFYACAFPVVFGVMFLIEKLVLRSGRSLPCQQPVVSLLETEQSGVLLTMAVGLVLVAPLLEEVIFRGFLCSALSETLGPKRAIVLSAACFALIHPTLSALLPIFLLGLLLGWAFLRTKTLAAPIAIHFINNVSSVVWLLTR